MSRRDAVRVGLLALAVALAGCTGDMYDQHRLKPMRPSDFWPDGRSVRDPVPGTVARGQMTTDTHFFSGKVAGKVVDTMPIPVDEALMARGQQRFQIYCTPCHGLDGEGRGTVVRRGMRQPPTFHQPRLREAPIGYFFDVMSHGFGVMYDFSYQLPPRDRWAVAAYIRALQLSQNGTVSDLTEEQRAALEKQP